MKLLVISDYFHNLKKSDDIEYVTWSEYKHISLIAKDCCLVDICFKPESQSINRQRVFYDLMKQLPALISRKGLLLIIICGNAVEYYEFDEPYDKNLPADNLQTIKFSCYDLLQNILPDYLSSVHFDTINNFFSLAQVPVHLYLDRYSSCPAFLYFDYDRATKKHSDIKPLATVTEEGDPCVAFEYKMGKGHVIILPSYDREEAEKTFLILLRICKFYSRNREVAKEITSLDHAIPEPIRSTLIEALVCFNYDLYIPALIMCRKALEESAINLGATKFNLNNKIKELFEGEKDTVLRQLAEQIKDFGNWVVHPEIYAGKEATEDDARLIINCLKNYFNYIYSIRTIIKATEKRKSELKEGG